MVAMDRAYKPQVIANTKDLSREEWLKLRKIGGSEAAIILGLNKYKTAYQLWLEKTGEIIPEELDSEAIHFGNVLEDVVAKVINVSLSNTIGKILSQMVK